MAATIKDIREKTGLSLATISKYLNGGNVLPENREKIEDAIKSLHYEVNEIARGLVTNRTRTVGVVVFSVESLFNGILLHHTGDILRQAGYGMLICDSGNNPDREAENIRFLLSKKVDGILAVPYSRSGEFLGPAREAGVPVVLLDRDLDEGGYDCVRIDNRLSARRAVETLVSRGHRKIACISSAAEYTGISAAKAIWRPWPGRGWTRRRRTGSWGSTPWSSATRACGSCCACRTGPRPCL